MIKKATWIILALMLLTLVFNWHLVAYGYQQASGQLKIIWNARDIQNVLAESSTPDSIKQKIKIIQEAKAFAHENLALAKTKNYTTYYDQNGQVALWNLSASEKFALEPKSWSFPLLGSFPYKGFFNLEEGKKEMARLREEGYEARIRPVGGWSTLGWTKDPILSNMIERAEGSLAELIIHELTHTTLFVKDNIDFNENLASFIGERGAIQYLNEKYGKNSDPFFEYILGEEDSQTFRNQMLLGTQKLDSLYKTFDKQDSDSAKNVLKHIMIDKITSSIDTLHFHNPRYYKAFSSTRPNNAYFMSYLRYYSSKDSLAEILSSKYKGNLKLFVKGMKDYHK
ncbi:aminopeptidase [Ekhidna sp.]